MDWSKAKNILILALIATNLFLLTTVENLTGRFSNPQQDDSAINILSAQGIYLDCEIGNYPRSLGKLTVSIDNLSTAAKERVLETQVPMDKKPYYEREELLEYINKFMKDNGLMYPYMEFSYIKVNGEVTDLEQEQFLYEDEVIFSFINVYQNKDDGIEVPITVMDSRFEIVFKEGSIKGLERNWLRPVKYEDEAMLDIMEAGEAISRYDLKRQSADDIYINEIELVFYLNNEISLGANVESDTAFPYWRLFYMQGEECREEFIPAYRE